MRTAPTILVAGVAAALAAAAVGSAVTPDPDMVGDVTTEGLFYAVTLQDRPSTAWKEIQDLGTLRIDARCYQADGGYRPGLRLRSTDSRWTASVDSVGADVVRGSSHPTGPVALPVADPLTQGTFVYTDGDGATVTGVWQSWWGKGLGCRIFGTLTLADAVDANPAPAASGPVR